MADARDIIHQIEYRWHDRRDLSPIASTMSQESLRAWDALIRAWVRHPHVDGLWESVCYQILPNGRAALAWRYEDWEAAEREDGTRGRPVVSRVLAGQASLLTAEAAIVLCRGGLPATAGPRPGQVTTETELPVVGADELSTLVRDRTAGLDEEAAGQEGLRQLVAAALSDPNAPLAVQIRDTHILRPPGDGLQCPLLWGLRRIVWPLFGTAGRGWSFSTFEPPLGDVDPATLPDILFRQAQDTPSTPPAMPRREIKVRPFDSSKLDDGSVHAELAGWLVDEYTKRGGDELGQVIAEWCGAESSPQPRLAKVHDQLCAMRSPAVMSGPLAPDASVSPVAADAQPVTAQAEAPSAAADEVPDGAGHDPVSRTEQDADWTGWFGDEDERQPGPAPDTAADPYPHAGPQPENAEHEQAGILPQPSAWDQETHGYSSRSWSHRTDDSLAPFPRQGQASPLPQWSKDERSPMGGDQRSRARAPRPATVSDLLKKLPEAADIEEFNSIAQAIFDAGARMDPGERVKARREVSKDEWYGKIWQQFGNILYPDILPRIFWLIVIPDLDNPDVIKKITEWAGRARPGVIAGLLSAAMQSGNDSWQLMMQILQPKLAHRWTIANGMESLWDPALAQQHAGGESGRGFFGFRKKG